MQYSGKIVVTDLERVGERIGDLFLVILSAIIGYTLNPAVKVYEVLIGIMPYSLEACRVTNTALRLLIVSALRRPLDILISAVTVCDRSVVGDKARHLEIIVEIEHTAHGHTLIGD